MNSTEVHERLIKWLAALLGIVVIKDHEQGTRPALPYGMLELASWGEASENVRDISYRELETLNAEGLKEVQATPELEIEWVFLFFVYGDRSDALMRRLASSAHLPQLQEPLMPELVLKEVSTINRIPELVSEKWEPRAQVNLTVRGVSSDGFVIDTIEDHPITITGERA